MSQDMSIQAAIEKFIAHKRALGRKYHSEQRELRLLARFAAGRGISRISELTPGLIEEFLASRPRPRPRSFNHLLGAADGLFRWAVTQEILPASPLRTRRRRVTSARIPFLFDAGQARQLLDAAAALPGNSRARGRGTVYHAIFALCYGLGLRAGEACGLRLCDIDTDRSLLVVRGGKFGKDRLAPHGPRIAAVIAAQADRRRGDGDHAGAGSPLFTFDGRRPVHPCTASQVFHALTTTLGFPVPEGVSPPTLHSLRHYADGRVMCPAVAFPLLGAEEPVLQSA